MKFLIFTLLLSFVMFFANAQTIFDPATFEVDSLPEGMEIVEINGTSYCQIILNGWNSSIPVDEVEITSEKTHMRMMTKLAVGTSGFEVAKINTFLKLANADFTEEVCAEGAGSTEDFQERMVPIANPGIVGNVQVAGQETTGWSAVVGDTLWIGKIDVITVDPSAIFDPNSIDEATLPEGMSIVDIDGEKYAQIILNGYGSLIEVPTFILEPGLSVTGNVKYKLGDATLAIPYTSSQIKSVVQLMDTINEVYDQWAADLLSPANTQLVQDPVNEEMVTLTNVMSSEMQFVHQIQFFGQDKVAWAATIGDTVWVGKITAFNDEPVDPTVIVDPATFDEASLASGWEIVELDGTKYFKVTLDGWSTWTNIPEFTFPEGTNGFKASVMYEKGTADYSIEEIDVFLKFSDPSWTEVAAGSNAASAEFKDYVVDIADISLTAGVFQIAGQENVSGGGTALTGDFMYISKMVAVSNTPVTFIVDDTGNKSLTDVYMKGSWNKSSREFDIEWDGGIDQTALFDDGTHGDETAEDNIWTVTKNLVSDGGDNTWEWGFLGDSVWIPSANIQFSVADETPVTSTYTIFKTSIEKFSYKVAVYPNPTSGILNISAVDVKSIDVYNLNGAKVIASQLSNNSIDVSSLAKGAYIVKVVNTQDEVAVSKFNKE